MIERQISFHQRSRADVVVPLGKLSVEHTRTNALIPQVIPNPEVVLREETKLADLDRICSQPGGGL